MRERARKRSIFRSLRHMAQVRVAKITVAGMSDDTLAKRFCLHQVKSGCHSGQILLTGCSDNGSKLQKSQGLPECNCYLHNNFSKPFNYDYENAKAKMRYQQVKVRSPHRPELDTEQSRTRCAQVMVSPPASKGIGAEDRGYVEKWFTINVRQLPTSLSHVKA